MRKGRYIRRRTASRMLTTALSLLLVVGLSVGGTLAWLTAQTEDVTNTFTVGDINIELKEHDYIPANKNLDMDNEVNTNDDYKFVPGDTLPKDPFVRVKAGSEKCYVFIKVTETHNTVPDSNPAEKVVNYAIDTDVWTPLGGVANVWSKVVDAVAKDANPEPTFNILKDQKVTISENVLKDHFNQLNTNKPTLNFKAAAIQFANMDDVNDAWANIPAEFKS